MKFIFTFIIMFGFAQFVFGQILLENFDYETGTKLSATSNWTESPAGSTDITVKTGNFTYTNYAASNIGNLIGLNGGASSRSGVLTSFTQILGNGSNLYASFLLKVTSTADLDSVTTTKDYFAAFRDTSRNVKKAYIYLRTDSNSVSPSSKFSIGLAKTGSSNLVWYGTELNVDSTYLIVIGYVFQNDNDFVKLWINPILSDSKPTADIAIDTGSDADSLGGFQLLQRSKSGDEDIDGLIIASNWASIVADVDAVVDGINAPSTFELSQNYPNPFNPGTQISFSLPSAAKVNLTVYNTLGQQVVELVNRNFEAGVHTVQFNASSLSSGIYFYKISTLGETGNFVHVRKMMFLK